jgi:hypothetical protein
VAVEREGRIFGFHATVIERPIAIYECLNVKLVSEVTDTCGEIVRHYDGKTLSRIKPRDQG